jgi:2-amino-4-hydroxy-6-hydroxymethyldihydropteridine diphosphokinase
VNTQEHQACLLLGSNIQAAQNLARGVNLLGQKVKVVRLSSIWETPSVGTAGPDFLNMAMLITTFLEAGKLKEQVLQPLEAQLGRVRNADKNAPRPIDIDIILFDGRLLDPNLFRYAHRAVPVAELLPDYQSERGEFLRNVAFKLAETSPIRQKPDLKAIQID